MQTFADYLRKEGMSLGRKEGIQQGIDQGMLLGMNAANGRCQKVLGERGGPYNR